MLLATEKTSVKLLDLDQPALTLPRNVLMCPPDYFDVVSIKNPHMEGNIGKINFSSARLQWKNVKNAFEECGIHVEILPAVAGLDDMVFTANQGTPFLDVNGKKKMLLAKMFAENRQGEIAPFAEWFELHGYEIVDCLTDENDFFEGNGDSLWHRGRKLLLMGYGYRSTFQSLEKIVRHIEIPVVAFQLTDPRFYHLDTCCSILDEQSAMILPEAFDEQGLELLQSIFPRLLIVDSGEAASYLACNAFCPDNKHVIINIGCPVTCDMLKKNGFIPIEVDTSEYGKSGGSVFCLKLSYW